MRFVLIVIIGFIPTLIQVFRAMHYTKHREKYSEEQCYRLVQTTMNRLRFIGNITTKAYGEENLPKDGGYILYSNHQGRYDTISVFLNHEKPCTVLMNEKKSRVFSITQIIDVLDGKRVDPKKIKATVRTLNQISEEVSKGRRYLIFPEGRHVMEMENHLLKFNSGCFKCAFDSGCPVVPVVLIDAFRAMNGNLLGHIDTEVHYLPPIFYEEYKDMDRYQLCALVRERIEKKIALVLAERAAANADGHSKQAV